MEQPPVIKKQKTIYLTYSDHDKLKELAGKKGISLCKFIEQTLLETIKPSTANE